MVNKHFLKLFSFFKKSKNLQSLGLSSVIIKCDHKGLYKE